MAGLGHARSFRELVVYQTAVAVAQEIFERSKKFPRDEMFSLTDQLRRSSRSIGAQLAEAWGKRRYQRHFRSKLTDADAEQLETQHWIQVAVSCGYLEAAAATALIDKLAEIGRMLHSMMQKADLFCGDASPTVREETACYLRSLDDCSLDD
jgi:four helix bundle protein